MKRGFYTIMSAQFFSSLADNALFVTAVELLRTSGAPEWQRAALVPMFALFYVLLTGVPVSVLRAGLVFAVALAGDFLLLPFDLLTAPALVVVGEVSALAAELHWFGAEPRRWTALRRVA